jgi:VIT1/CCC1 family predicted Fe2+/Mn2+ transporter
MREQDKLAFHRAVLEMLRHAGTGRAHLRRSDFAAAALIAALVAATAIPAVIPLLLLQDGQRALRIANITQIVLLFSVGYGWAHYSGTNRWRAGILITLLGIGLILVAVALGG